LIFIVSAIRKLSASKELPLANESCIQAEQVMVAKPLKRVIYYPKTKHRPALLLRGGVCLALALLCFSALQD